MPRYQQDYDDYDLDCDELRRQRRNRKRWAHGYDDEDTPDDAAPADDDLFEFAPEDPDPSPTKP